MKPTICTLLTILTVLCTNAQVPTYGSCLFDNTNGTSGSIVVARETGASFLIAPQFNPLNIIFGANASAAASGLNEVVAQGGTLTNATGGDISEVILSVKGAGYWTQTVSGTVFRYYTWNQAQQRFEGVLGDGRAVHVYLLGMTVGGTAVPASQIQLMPFNATASGYTFGTTNAGYLGASFTDAGTGTVYTAPPASLSMPTNLLTAKLGSLPNGSTMADVRVQFGLQIIGGTSQDAWVNYIADGSPAGDYDYYFQAELMLQGIPYDYGDAPASYGIARHASGLCTNALFIGTARQDYETSTTGSVSVNADDNNLGGYNDEDVTASVYNGTTSYSLTVPYNNNTGSPAYISSWIDWNNDGSFQNSERASVTIPAGASSANLVWRTSGAALQEGTIPAGITPGDKITRIRIASLQAEVAVPTGTAANGEVEDLKIVVAGVLPVTFGDITASIHSHQLFVGWSTLQENNNDYFDVEVSKDGVAFISVGAIKSKVQGAGSSQQLYYNFSMKLNEKSGILLGLMLIGIGVWGNRRRKALLWVIPVLAGILLFVSACTKSSSAELTKQKLFVRIAQTDIDGNKTYSKTVQVVSE